jgi:hypothetical protein
MKIVVSSCGRDVADEYFRIVGRSVINFLSEQGHPTVPSGINLSFICQVQLGTHNPDDMDVVTLSHTYSTDKDEMAYLEQVSQAIQKTGRRWKLCPCNNIL